MQPVSEMILAENYQRGKEQRVSVDRLTTMPDEVLVLILSLLPTKAAARTSVLCRRWKPMWKNVTRLDFDWIPPYLGDPECSYKKQLKDRVAKYVCGVNQALMSHKNPTLEEFRVMFHLEYASSKHDLNKWLGFALEKRAKRITFEFHSGIRYLKKNYQVTLPFLSHYDLSSLVTLHLKYVDLTGEVLENILCSSPSLEVLSVTGANSMVDVKVCGPSLNLKQLEIVGCNNLISVEISAEKLESFKMGGKVERIMVNKAPKLRKASFPAYYAPNLIRELSRSSLIFYQLEELVLFLNTDAEYILGSTGSQVLSLPNAKHSQHCLNAVELVGFSGTGPDKELAMSFLNNCMALKEIVIDLRNPFHDYYWGGTPDMSFAKWEAGKLKTLLSKRVNIVIRETLRYM